MKRFLKYISIFALIFIALYLFLIYASFYIIPHNKEHYVYMQKVKMERLDSITSPRILLVGGSNVAFGFDTKALNDSLSRNVYNTGLHASIGLRYILDAVSDHLEPGDIVVILPEYSQFSNAYNGNVETLTSAIIYSGASELSKLNTKQWLNFLMHIPTHNIQNITAKGSDMTYSYSAVNFNEYGDEVRHNDFPAPGVTSSPTKLTVYDDDAIEEFSFRVKKMRNDGCKVIILGPTCIESVYKLNIDFINGLSQRLSERGVEFDAPPSYFVNPDSLAFDTYYHMTLPAVIANTEKLKTLLQKYE